ncbi:hypothetical protein P0D91_05015 [Pseudomonas sp. CBSPBW29]|nr:hypothetical protein P0D91_05015 [Pseudomonas sp. CBSPBW29]
MEYQKRTLYINQLAREISLIGQPFEIFGGLFLRLVLNIPVGSQGVNAAGFPVAGVVDGVSADGLIAAEYSAEKCYFTSSMAKARKDLEHVLRKASSAREIYLVAGSKKRPQSAKKFVDDVMASSQMKGRTLHMLGAEEIATSIVDQGLLSDDIVLKMSAYLPSLAKFADEEAAQALVPIPDDRRLSRPEVDRHLDELLSLQKCIVISGMGGTGKSDTAAALAHRNRDQYQTVIWLSGAEVPTVEKLSAVAISRIGELRNVAGLLKHQRCLLIIDDANEELRIESLTTFCAPGSNIVLTRRKSLDGAYQLPLMSRGEALTLVNRDVEHCPPGVFQKIWKAVGGHALTINLINAAVAEGTTWDDIELDCRAPGILDSNGQTLADILLGRLRAVVQSPLSVFEWADQPNVDAELLKTLTAPSVIRLVQKHGLVAADRPNVVRLHDVVFNSLSVQPWWGDQQRAPITEKVCNYLGHTATKTGLSFWSAAANLHQRIQHLVTNGERHPALIYALALVWSPAEVEPALLGDPVKLAALVRARTSPTPVITTMALLETIEKLYLHEKIRGEDHAKDQLALRLMMFDDLESAPGLTSKQRSEILHHKGKALNRLDRKNEALHIFRSIMAGEHPLAESEVQIMRLLRLRSAEEKDEASQIVERILSAAESAEPVSHSVFFAAVEHAVWLGRGDLLLRYEPIVEKWLVEAALREMSQAVQTLSSIARFLSREAPLFLSRLLERIPRPLIDDIPQSDKRFDWGDILLEASRTAGESASRMQSEALVYFESLNPKPFHQQRHAELLLLMNRPVEAKQLLETREDLASASFVQRLMALAEHQMGNSTQALSWMSKALENLEPKNEKFRSVFHEHQFDFMSAITGENPEPELIKSIALSQEGHEQERLKLKLAKYQEQVKGAST